MGNLRLKFSQLGRWQRQGTGSVSVSGPKPCYLSSLWGCRTSGSEINIDFLRPQELASGISQMVKMMRFWGKNYWRRLCNVFSWVPHHMALLWEDGPFSLVQFSRSVVSDSLRPHESQHARPPCPFQTPGVHSYSCPSSRWCHPAITSSVVPSSFCPQFLPASGSEWVNSSHEVARVLEFQLQHQMDP